MKILILTEKYTVLQEIIYSYDFKLLIVGLKNEIFLIFAISFAFLGKRKEDIEPKMVVSSKFKFWSSLLSEELFRARFAMRLTLRDL